MRDLLKGPGDGVQARDPVVVILGGGEGQLCHQLGISSVDAVYLRDRHFPFLELRCFLIHFEAPLEELLAELFLIREAVGIEGSQPHQKILLAGELVVDRGHRVIGDLVVVAIVTECGG